MDDRAVTVNEVCERYGVSEQTVLGWIHSGELQAINVGRRRDSKKPRWRVTSHAIVAFEESRMRTTALPRTKPRNQKPSSNIIEFYK